jgi:hypothetical protein
VIELRHMISIDFLVGLIVGGIGGYSIKVFFTNKFQKTKGDKSPNVMGDGNSLRM